MSRFLSKSTAAMMPYVPGEQPRDQQYIKLNTNENPYPPSPGVAKALREQNSADLRLYPDPDAGEFTAALAACYGLAPDQVLACGGSDEALAYTFMAFFDRGDRVYFPDITYGFYRVYADLFGLTTVEVPLREDFSLTVEDYFDLDGNLFIANPNAPTGTGVAPSSIEEILRRNPDRLVVVDEAYVDFAPGMSCIDLIARYDNLLVIQTFSKSRALAGMRLGAAFGQSELIAGLNRIKYSFNPYNLDRVSLAVGIAGIRDKAYTREIVGKVIGSRERVKAWLWEMDFTVLPSDANFLFVRHPQLSGGELYAKLRENGILVRHFEKPRIGNFVRLTIGTDAEMNQFIKTLRGWQ